MIKQMVETIEKHRMIEANDKIVVGISGGPDSLAMLHALYHFKDTYKIELVGVHINHLFRGDAANADEAFVQQFCEAHHIKLYSHRIDVSEYAKSIGTSFEDAGRKVRYRYFMEALEKEKAQKIAIAHNRNDLIETFFINLFRGAGVDGLSSIDYVREKIYIRPILDVSRDEIEAYCKENHLEPRIDHTNSENDYLRNRIRNEFMPSLRENYNLNMDMALYKTVQLMKYDKEFWHVHTEKLFNLACKWERNSVRIDKKSFGALQEAEQFRLMRLCIYKIKGSLNNISMEMVIRACSLTKTGTAVYLDMIHHVRLDYESIIVEKCLETQFEQEAPTLHLRSVTLKEYAVIRNTLDYSRTIALDRDCIKGTLSVRHRKNGDVFKPFGMSGHKKLKDFLIDEKVSKNDREQLWLVCDDEKIIWVAPLRMSDSCKITKETENILLISFVDIVDGSELC